MRGNCPKCGTPYTVVDSKHDRGGDTMRVRYIGCRGCGYRPADNKEIVPLAYAPRRACHR